MHWTHAPGTTTVKVVEEPVMTGRWMAAGAGPR